MTLSDEIVAGLVLHLDPDALERSGATYTGPPTRRVQGAHFFICIEGDSSGPGRWAPLFSHAGADRVELDESTAYGHPKWTSGHSYLHPAQIWEATPAAVEAAAIDGRDMSRAGARNGVGASSVSAL